MRTSYIVIIFSLFFFSGCSKLIVPLPFLGWAVVEEGSGSYDKEDGKQYRR